MIAAGATVRVNRGTSNTMWRKLFYSGFETCFGPSTLTSQIQILRHFEKKGRDVIWD